MKLKRVWEMAMGRNVSRQLYKSWPRKRRAAHILATEMIGEKAKFREFCHNVKR